jgi:hypothetical protein
MARQKENKTLPLDELFEFLHSERAALAAVARNPCSSLPPGFEDQVRKRLSELQANDLCVHLQDVERIRGRSGLGYQEIYSGPEMTLCIFMLRKGACIPLHDHPGMHVFGRLLFGKMSVLSLNLDPATEEKVQLPDGYCGASFRSCEVIGPSPVTYAVGPQDGNLHELRAREASAFFDILTPPYDPYEGRDCNYYRCEADDGNGGYVLAPTYLENFSMDSLPYRGQVFVR